MPDTRSHRGSHPDDPKMFGESARKRLHNAVADMSLLLTRGYAQKSSMKLVGDRYELSRRQRIAVMRCACSDQQLVERSRKQVLIDSIRGGRVWIDGYNQLITVETALSKAPLFIARDGALRDLASLHGTYRRVEETRPALEILGKKLKESGAERVYWLLDRPVSNSGRLKKMMEQIAEKEKFAWVVDLVQNPDKILPEKEIAATSDSVILDSCRYWLNLSEPILRESGAHWILNFSGES